MRAVSAGMLLAAAFCPAVSGQQVWSNLWPSAHGMDAIDAELAADDDNTTQMRVFAPIRAGASLSVDLRSAVKVTHVVRIVPRTPPWAAAGRCWLLTRVRRRSHHAQPGPCAGALWRSTTAGPNLWGGASPGV